MAVGHVGVFGTIFKCQTLCQILQSGFSYTVAVWVDEDHKTIESDEVKSVNHRTGKVKKSTQSLQSKYIYIKSLTF